MATISETLKEGAEAITCSLNYFKEYSQEMLGKDCDWLKTISDYGISIYLQRAEKNGWITSKTKKGDNTGTLYYYTTAKGRKMIDERM